MEILTAMQTVRFFSLLTNRIYSLKRKEKDRKEKDIACKFLRKRRSPLFNKPAHLRKLLPCWEMLMETMSGYIKKWFVCKKNPKSFKEAGRLFRQKIQIKRIYSKITLHMSLGWKTDETGAGGSLQQSTWDHWVLVTDRPCWLGVQSRKAL